MGSLAIAGWGPLDGPLVECIYRVTLHLSCISAAVAEDLSPTPALPVSYSWYNYRWPSSLLQLPCSPLQLMGQGRAPVLHAVAHW